VIWRINSYQVTENEMYFAIHTVKLILLAYRSRGFLLEVLRYAAL